MQRSVGQLTTSVKEGGSYLVQLSALAPGATAPVPAFVSIRFLSGGKQELNTLPAGLEQSPLFGPGQQVEIGTEIPPAQISLPVTAPKRAKFVELSVHPLADGPLELASPIELIDTENDSRRSAIAPIAPLQRIDYLGEFTQTCNDGVWIRLEAELSHPDPLTPDARLYLIPAWYGPDGRGADVAQSMLGCQDLPGFGKSREVTLLPTTPSDPTRSRFSEPFYVPRGAPHGTFQLVMLNGQPGAITLGPTTATKIAREEVLQGEALSQLTRHQLGSAAEIAEFLWDLPARARIHSSLAALEPGSESLARKARHIRGALRELNTDWLPDLPPVQPYAPDPQAVLHLLKVTYPDESSGGAVRSTSIMEAQVAQGLHPVAALPLAAPRDPASVPPRDGVTQIVRDGVTYAYLDFAELTPRHVVPTRLLSFETNLHQRLIEQHRISLIHAASGFRGYENALKGLALARANDLPLVYEVRSFHEHTWRPLSRTEASDGLTELRKRQEERCMAEADAVVTISEAMVENLHERGVPRDKLFFVPNSIEKEFETLAPIEPSDALRRANGMGDRTTLGYISNFSLREGHIVLLDAFARLVEAGHDLHLVLVGDGPERDTIRKAAERRNLIDRVTLPGNVDHSEIKAWYRTIDLFIVPRIEDFASDYVTPLKPFEAMSQLVPVLMSDRPVTAEIAGPEQERAGIFPTGDVDALMQLITQSLSDRPALQRRAEAARDWVLNERVWASTVKRYAAAYDAARARHGAQAGEA